MKSRLHLSPESVFGHAARIGSSSLDPAGSVVRRCPGAQSLWPPGRVGARFVLPPARTNDDPPPRGPPITPCVSGRLRLSELYASHDEECGNPHGQANAHRLAAIPGAIVHGRHDACTPLQITWDLHRAWPQAAFTIVSDVGDTGTEPGIMHAMTRATDPFAKAAA